MSLVETEDWLTKYVSGKIESFDSFSKTGTEVDGSSVKGFGSDYSDKLLVADRVHSNGITAPDIRGSVYAQFSFETSFSVGWLPQDQPWKAGARV